MRLQRTALVLGCLLVLLTAVSQADQKPWRLIDSGQSDQRPLSATFLDLDPDWQFNRFHYGWDFAARLTGSGYTLHIIEPSALVFCRDDDPDGIRNFVMLQGENGYYYQLLHLRSDSVYEALLDLGFPEEDCNCSHNSGGDTWEMNLELSEMNEPIARSREIPYPLHFAVSTSPYDDFISYKLPSDSDCGFPILRDFADDLDPDFAVGGVDWPEVIYIHGSNEVRFHAWDVHRNPGRHYYYGPDGVPQVPGRPENDQDRFYDGLWRAVVFDETLGTPVGEMILNNTAHCCIWVADVFVDVGGEYWYRMEFDGLPGPPERMLGLYIYDYNGNEAYRPTDHPVPDEEGIWDFDAWGDGDRVVLHWWAYLESPGSFFYYAVSIDGGLTYEWVPCCEGLQGEHEYFHTLTVENSPIERSFGYVFLVEYPDIAHPPPAAIERGELSDLPPVEAPPQEAPSFAVASIGEGTITIEVVGGASWSENYKVLWNGEPEGSGHTQPPNLTYPITGLADGSLYEVQVQGCNEVGDGPLSASHTSTPARAPEVDETLYDSPLFWISWSVVPGGEEYRLKYRRIFPEEGTPAETEWTENTSQAFEAAPGEKYSISTKTRNLFGDETDWHFAGSYWTIAPCDVPEDDGALPSVAVWPNPTRDWLQISYDARKGEMVCIQVVEATGRVIGSARHPVRSDGRQSLRVNLRRFLGPSFRSGVFFVRVQHPTRSETRRLIILE